MTNSPTTTRPSRWRIWLVVALMAVLALVIGGQWWAGRPKRAAEHFISLLSKGQYDQASAMLTDATALTTAPGSAVFKAADGTTAALSEAELPLVTLMEPRVAPRAGVMDYLAGRYRFCVGTSGPAVRNAEKKAVELHCAAEGDRVVIMTVKHAAD